MIRDHTEQLTAAVHALPDASALYTARQDALGAIDLVECMQAAARLILAAERLKDLAEAQERAMRAALAATMADTGCPSVRIAGFTVSVVEPAPKLAIDMDALPDRYKARQEKIVANTMLIKGALENGATIPGVSTTNGGAPHVQFRSRKD
jgi:hypothetical protein